jgi:hypothetical protein
MGYREERNFFTETTQIFSTPIVSLSQSFGWLKLHCFNLCLRNQLSPLFRANAEIQSTASWLNRQQRVCDNSCYVTPKADVTLSVETSHYRNIFHKTSAVKLAGKAKVLSRRFGRLWEGFCKWWSKNVKFTRLLIRENLGRILSKVWSHKFSKLTASILRVKRNHVKENLCILQSFKNWNSGS